MPPRKATTAKKAEPSPDVQPTVIVPVVEPSAQAAPEPAAKPAPKAKPAAKPKAKPTAKPKAKPANMSAAIAPKPVAAVAAKTAPKPKARAKPKSPEYIQSGSDGEVPTIECPPQTPKKSPRKRPIKSYAESDDSDFAPNPSPQKKRFIAKEVSEDDEDPFVDHPTNILVDNTAQEDNTQVEEALEDDDAMDVDEGDTCEEDGEEEEEVTEETKGAIEPTSVVSEVAEDDAEDAEDDGEDGDEDAEDAEEDAGDAEEDAEDAEEDAEDAEEDAEENEEDDAEPVATSDLSELPEEEWDEDAFYDTSLPTEKNPFDIVPGTLPPHDMSVTEEAMDPELMPFKVYDYENLRPLAPGNFVAPAAANVNFDDDGRIIMNMENWFKMGVAYKGNGPPPHPKAIHIKDLARILSFKQAYSIASPALADPTDGFRAKFIGGFAKPGSNAGDSIRWEVHLGKFTCLFVDTVGITSSHLKEATNAFGTTLRYVTGIDHRFFLERKMGFFNTIFRKPELELRMLDSTTYSYETKAQSTGPTASQNSAPKSNIFATSTKMTYNASPSKSSSTYTKGRDNRPHTFDANEDVPVYDGTDPKKPVPMGFKLLDLSKHLDTWHGEVPEGSVALIGYIAHVFYWRGAWRLKFYVQWVVVLGVPGKSINDALKDTKKASPVKKGTKSTKVSPVKKK